MIAAVQVSSVCRRASVSVLAALFLLAPRRGHAQDAAASTPEPVASHPHRFFDVPNIALTVAESGALLADGIFTQRARHRYPERFRELDPLARPFVMRGWPGQIAGGILVVSADVGLRYLLHRKGHHLAERLLPSVLITYGLVGAIHGARELRRTEECDRKYGLGLALP